MEDGKSLKLNEIWSDLFDIECDLIGGRIQTGYDKLMCATKSCYGEIMESMIIDVGQEVGLGTCDYPVELGKVEAMYNNLRSFQNTHEIEELNKPLEDLKSYIKQRQNQESQAK